MKKTLLTYDEGSAIRDINIINKKVIPEIYEKLVPLFNKLGIGSMNRDLFYDLVESDGSKTVETIVKETNRQLDAGKIKLPSLRQSMLSESLRDIEQLKVSASQINLQYGKQVRNIDGSENNYLKHLSFDEKGIPFLSDEGRTAIQESYKLYVTSDSGHALKNMHQKATDAINEFLNEVQKAKKITGIFPLAQVFKIVDGDTVTVEPIPIPYDILAAV